MTSFAARLATTMTNPTPIRRKIGLAIVTAIPPGTTVWDTDLKGFCARRQRTGVSYMLKTRVNGRIRWFTIGRHGQPWTPDSARKRALQILANPGAADVPPPEAAMTFARVAEQFMATHGPKLKRRSTEEYQRWIRVRLVPAFGDLPITDITRAQISAAHASWKESPRAANYALAVLSKIFSWAEDQGYRPEDSNPCRRVQRFKEARRERFLSPDELSRLGMALDNVTKSNGIGPFAIAAIRLLILTGARLNEILTLEWSHIDIERKSIFLPDSKTGRKTIILNDAALEVLKAIPRFANNRYVIVGNKNGGHLVNLQKPWRIVRKLAGLDIVRLHDLRHTFASTAVSSGGSLPVLGRQLGHSQPQTTHRYAHLTDDPVRELTQTTGNALSAALQMRPGSSDANSAD